MSEEEKRIELLEEYIHLQTILEADYIVFPPKDDWTNEKLEEAIILMRESVKRIGREPKNEGK